MPASAPDSLRPRSANRLQRWWASQSPHRQDRLAGLAPLLAVVLFFATILAVFGYLRLEEVAREHEAISRDVEYTQQRLRLRLLEQQEQLLRFAREIASREVGKQDFLARVEVFVNRFPELQAISWLDEKRRLLGRYATARLESALSAPSAQPQTAQNDEVDYFTLARELMLPLYSTPRTSAGQPPTLALYLPLNDKGQFKGNLIVEYSLDAIHRYGVPDEVSAKYAIALLDARGQLLAGNLIQSDPRKRPLLPWASPINQYELPLSPVGNGVTLRGMAYRTSLGVIGSGLFWLVMVLSAITAWLLLTNWGHTRRRIQVQEALVQETAFRRAMESSMLTGMRAMDLQGRIIYVNKAFCTMTGWSEEDLVGKTAPFPYWPEEDTPLLFERLREELAGQILPSGIQFRVKRKDGSLMDARLFVSPLIDAFGQQTGWMTSMIDVTEPNQVREQLAASHERFTTVLEALDASISVGSLSGNELLFANKLYRQWFGTMARGHQVLVQQAGLPTMAHSDEDTDAVDALAGMPADELAEQDTESAEVYIDVLGRWLEVRTRYLSWVDGRLAQMVIATDITPRRLAEEQTALQAQRAQNASRLITMGEMASSVAHELNQPLTAIQNYCNGMISRLKGHQIDTEALLIALEKTAHQASRAGQIIQRIRAFVKRSEPNRSAAQVATLVAEAVELADIELRRRNVRLVQEIAPGLPTLWVDPILIEQVLLNLLKNAAESIDVAQRPSAQRVVRLSAQAQSQDGKPVVQFCVYDTGTGIAPDVMTRLYETFYSTKAEGMGIGLSLCRSIVESHLGRLSAENLYNGETVCGCCFTFWIPVLAVVPQTVRDESISLQVS
ncbi:MAG: oxygen sensor histidine kinase FixL [Rhodoferax sp.]